MHALNHIARLNGNVHAAVDLACAQAKLGHTVCLCSSGGDFDHLLESHNVQSFRIDHSRTTAGLLRGLIGFRDQIRAWKPDVVHTHMVTSALLAFPICVFYRVPLITTVHNAFERGSVLMGIGSRVIAVSRAVGVLMRSRGVPSTKIRVVLNGTIGSVRHAAPAAAAPDTLGPAVLFVGGLHPRKGVADLLTAFEIVHRRAPSARLLLVGEGPDGELYKAMAATMECRDNVVFCGAVKDPRGYLRAADVLVLPSHADPAPLVLSEAREAGCAIVATSVDGIPEMLEDGAAGILVPPRDPVKLASALAGLLDDPGLLTHWKQRSQVNLSRMLVSRVATETIDVYLECLRPSRYVQSVGAMT